MGFARLVVMGTLVCAASALGAQKPAGQGSAQAKAAHDSLRTMKKDVKRKRAQAKAAKAAGDTARAKVLKKEAKAEKKKVAAMKQGATPAKDAPSTKKP